MRASLSAGRAVAVLGACVLGGAPAALFAAVQRGIEAPGPGRVVVLLDRDVYERARADLGDLRVVDDTLHAAPYLLERVQEEVPAPPRRPNLRNRAFVRGQSAQVTLDFGAPTLKTELALSLSGDNFRRRVIVEGRNRHDATWLTLTDAAYVFAVPGPPAARYESILLPENNYQLLRVTVERGPDDPDRIEILEAWTRPATHRLSRETPLAPRVSRTEDQGAHETILTLDLRARHQPFRGVVLDIADATFFRGVVVEARMDPPGATDIGASLPLAWRYLGESALYRYEVDGAPREALRLDVSGRERVLRLRIRNRDDAPLKVRQVSVLAPVERLAFEAEAGRAYVLRYGDPEAGAPSYDLARTAGDPALWAARAQEGRLAAAADVPVPVAPQPAWTERHPSLLWCGLIVIVAALGTVTWRALHASM